MIAILCNSFWQFQLTAQRVRSGWEVVWEREQLRFVSVDSGVPSVVTPGTALMLVWSVGSWDTLCWVSMTKIIAIHEILSICTSLVVFYRSYSIYQCSLWKKNWTSSDWLCFLHGKWAVSGKLHQQRNWDHFIIVWSWWWCGCAMSR